MLPVWRFLTFQRILPPPSSRSLERGMITLQVEGYTVSQNVRSHLLPRNCHIPEGLNPQKLFLSPEWYIFLDSVPSFKTSLIVAHLVSSRTAAVTVATTRTVTGDFWAPSAMTRRVHQTTIGTSAITTAARDSVRKIRSGVTMIHQVIAHCLRYNKLLLHYFQL